MNTERSFSVKDTNVYKGIAILLVLGISLFCCADRLLYNYTWEIGGRQALNYIFDHLKIAVTIFIILSGYGLNESYKRSHKECGEKSGFNFAFLRGRLSKLLVNYWIIFVLSAGVGLAFGWVSVAGTWGGIKSFLVDFFGVQYVVNDFWHTKTLNGTWWFVSVIIVLYILFPLIKRVMRFNPFIPSAIGALLIIVSPYASYAQINSGFLYYLAAFSLGILFSEKQVFNRIKNCEFKHKWIIAAVSVLTAGAAFAFNCYKPQWADLPFALSFMFMVQVIFINARNKVAEFFKTVISFIGKHSFNIFALHAFYITIYGNSLIYKLKNPALMYAVLLVVSLGVSVILEKLKDISRVLIFKGKSCDAKELLSPKEAVPFDKTQSMKIKGVAICLLLFHHLFYAEYRLNYGGIVTHLISKETLMSVGTYARICVWLFVFVSAYGLSKSYLSIGENITMRERLAFYKKHYFSLMKPYWFIWTVVFTVSLIFKLIPVSYLKNNIIYIILNFLGLSDFFGTPSMNNVWWYMCLAQVILLIIPLICEMAKRWGKISFPLLFILVQFINMAGVSSVFGGEYINYFFMVIFGVLFARYNIMEKISATRFTVLEFFLLIIVICTGMYLNRNLGEIDLWKISKLLLSISTLGICIFTYKINVKGGGVFGKLLIFLGKYSGNMFLVHTFLFDKQYKPELVYWSHNVVLSWLSCIVLSLIISIMIEFIKKLLLGQFIWRREKKSSAI